MANCDVTNRRLWLKWGIISRVGLIPKQGRRFCWCKCPRVMKFKTRKRQEEDEAEHTWSMSQIVFKWKAFCFFFSPSPSYLIVLGVWITPLWQINGFVFRSNKAQGVLLTNYRDVTPGLKSESLGSHGGVFIFCKVELLFAVSIAKVRL